MEILSKAKDVVYHSRQKEYGDVKTNFEKTAKIWSAILGYEVTPQQVSLCMIGLKISRESFAHKEDNLVDIAGYAAISGELNKQNG